MANTVRPLLYWPAVVELRWNAQKATATAGDHLDWLRGVSGANIKLATEPGSGSGELIASALLADAAGRLDELNRRVALLLLSIK